jgi:hypothetical protein
MPNTISLGGTIADRSIGTEWNRSEVGQLRQPEVHDLNMPLAREHDVVRLRERICQLAGHLKGLLQLRSSATAEVSCLRRAPSL